MGHCKLILSCRLPSLDSAYPSMADACSCCRHAPQNWNEQVAVGQCNGYIRSQRDIGLQQRGQSSSVWSVSSTDTTVCFCWFMYDFINSIDSDSWYCLFAAAAGGGGHLIQSIHGNDPHPKDSHTHTAPCEHWHLFRTLPLSTVWRDSSERTERGQTVELMGHWFSVMIFLKHICEKRNTRFVFKKMMSVKRASGSHSWSRSVHPFPHDFLGPMCMCRKLLGVERIEPSSYVLE